MKRSGENTAANKKNMVLPFKQLRLKRKIQNQLYIYKNTRL